MDLCIALSDVVADYVTIVLSFLDNLAKKTRFHLCGSGLNIPDKPLPLSFFKSC